MILLVFILSFFTTKEPREVCELISHIDNFQNSLLESKNTELIISESHLSRVNTDQVIMESNSTYYCNEGNIYSKDGISQFIRNKKVVIEVFESLNMMVIKDIENNKNSLGVLQDFDIHLLGDNLESCIKNQVGQIIKFEIKMKNDRIQSIEFKFNFDSKRMESFIVKYNQKYELDYDRSIFTFHYINNSSKVQNFDFDEKRFVTKKNGIYQPNGQYKNFNIFQ